MKDSIHLSYKLRELTEKEKSVKEEIALVKAQLLQAKISESRPEFYRIGQKFHLEYESGLRGEDYLLAQVREQEYNLIGLESANRWTAPLKRDGLSCNLIPARLFHDHFTTIKGAYWRLNP